MREVAVVRSPTMARSRRNAPCGARTGPQLFGEGTVELFGGLGRALLPGEHFAFDAQAYLVEFPVLETGG